MYVAPSVFSGLLLRTLGLTGGLLKSVSLSVRAASWSFCNNGNGKNIYFKLFEACGKQHFQNSFFFYFLFLILIWNKIVSLVEEEVPALCGVLGLGVLVPKEEVGR